MEILQGFIFDGLPIRGKLLRFDAAWQEQLKRHIQKDSNSLTPFLVSILGEMTAAAVLLRSDLKFDGALTVQIFGTGSLKVAVAEVQADLGFRSTVSFDAPMTSIGSFEALINPDGRAKCAVTLTPSDGDMAPYQGIVPLVDENNASFCNVSSAFMQYMRQSEQLETVLVLAANEYAATGLLIQCMPLEGGASLQEKTDSFTNEEVQEHFQRIAILAQSVTQHELLTLDQHEILHRLFWQEQVMLLTQSDKVPSPHFHCSCTRQRVSGMLKNLGKVEAEAILADKGMIDVDCNFCGMHYCFDPIDVTQIFLSSNLQSVIDDNNSLQQSLYKIHG